MLSPESKDLLRLKGDDLIQRKVVRIICHPGGLCACCIELAWKSKSLRCPHPRSPSLTHLRLPSSTAVHSTTRPIESCRAVSILRSWPAQPKCAVTTVPFLGYTAHDGESTLSTALGLISLSHLLVSFSFFAISLAVRCLSYHLLQLRFSVPLSLFTPARTGLASLLPLPSLFPSPPLNGSKRTAED